MPKHVMDVCEEKRKINTKLEVLSFRKARKEIEIDISDLSPLVFIVISEFVFSEPHRHNIKKIVFDMVWWSSYHYIHYYCLAPYFVIAL